MFWPGHAKVQSWARSALESWDVGWQLGMMVQIKPPLAGDPGTFPWILSCCLVTQRHFQA